MPIAQFSAIDGIYLTPVKFYADGPLAGPDGEKNLLYAMRGLRDIKFERMLADSEPIPPDKKVKEYWINYQAFVAELKKWKRRKNAQAKGSQNARNTPCTRQGCRRYPPLRGGLRPRRVVNP
jgi:hypothetical protein